MLSIPWRNILQILTVIFVLATIAWLIYDPGWDPIVTLLGGIITYVGSLFAPSGEPTKNIAINGKNNVLQKTTTGHNISAPNGKVVAVGSISIDQYIQQSEAPKSQQLPHEIPPPPADFTGRDEELQDLREHFKNGVTITGVRGMGGIGKTALAFKLAKDLADRYPDGQILVAMKGTDPLPLIPAEAMAHVIRAYDPEARLPEGENEIGNAYRTTLHGKRALLLLDNAADDWQIRQLLPPDTCGVIVTSRQKIALQGLMPIDLNILEPDKAVELLLRIRRPDEQPIASPQEEESWKEIARLCGYLPLALRAAGSFLANRPDINLNQYITELRDELTRLERIGKEGTDLDVEASFNLSYRRIPFEIAKAFRMLSVFPADFDAKAEEAVCQDEGHRHLSELVRWSLAKYQEENGRYHLHDLIRLFAAGHLEKEDDEAAMASIKRHHAEHYITVLSVCDVLYLRGGENVLAGLKLFDLEWPNIRAGQAWAESEARADQENENALRLCSSYSNTGINVLDLRLRPSERIRWLEAALDAVRRLLDRRTESAVLDNLGAVYRVMGEYRRAIEFHEQALGIAREIGDRSGEGKALGNLGNAYSSLSEYRSGIKFYEQALVIVRDIGDRLNEGIVLGNLGNAYCSLSEYRKAIELHEQALVIARKTGDRLGEDTVLGNLGNDYIRLASYRKAIEFHEQRLAIAREIGNRRGEGQVLQNLGVAYASMGEYRKAIEFYEQSLAIAREIGDRSGEGKALGALGNDYYHLGEYRKAIEFNEQYLAIAREIGDRSDEGMALGNLGNVYCHLDKYRKAIKFYEQHTAIAKEIGDRMGEGNALGNLGVAYAAIGEYRKAIKFHEQSIAIAREIGNRSCEINALGGLGYSYKNLGEHRKVIEFNEQYLGIAREIEDRSGEGKALRDLAIAYDSLGEYRKGIDLHKQSLVIYREVGDSMGEGEALFIMSLVLNEIGDRVKAADYAKSSLNIYERIGSPEAAKVRRILAELQD